MSREDILAVGKVAVGSIWPDLTVIFDVDEQAAATRLNPLLDRMEQKGAQFHRRVRQGFLDQADAAPEDHVVLDATAGEDEVFDSLIQRLTDRFSK